MKYCLKFLLLLVTSLMTETAPCQSLALGQLIQFNKQDGLTVNNYLINKGWVFESHQQLPSDSSAGTMWVYVTPNKKQTAQLERYVKEGYHGRINYATSSYATFEAIRQQALGYKMELVSEAVNGDAITNRYRGVTYDLWLSVSKPASQPTTTWYSLELSNHGLVKVFISLDGKEPELRWVSESSLSALPPLSPLQDSIIALVKRRGGEVIPASGVPDVSKDTPNRSLNHNTKGRKNRH